MPAKDMGIKYTCFRCGAKFYDLKRPEPLCPKCGADQREAVVLRAQEKSERKRSRAAVEEPAVDEEVLDEPIEEEEEDSVDLSEDSEDEYDR